MGKLKTIHPNHVTPPRNFCRLPNGYGVVKIGVSGTAEIASAGLGAVEAAKAIGREIATQGAIITTGATTGFPLLAAMGAKDVCGFSIGLSPAATEKEHIEVYGLPTDFMDVVVYTGFGYSGRDLLFVRSSDAMVIGPGRIGTLNEFTVSFEDHRPIGVLEGPWHTDEFIRDVINASQRKSEFIVFESDPKKLVARLIEMVAEVKVKNYVFQNHDGWSATGKGADVIL